MFEQPRWHAEAGFAIAAGLLWLWVGAHSGALAFAVAIVPAVMLLASGGSTLLWPGDHRIPHFMALGGVLGVVLAALAWPALGLAAGGTLIALCAASFIAAGTVSVRQEPHVEDVPLPRPSLRLWARVGLDEAVMASLQAWMRFPRGAEAARVHREVIEATEFFEERGWLDKPIEYHAQPPALAAPQVQPGRARGFDFEHLSFESEYEPHVLEPGRDRFLAYTANRTAHAWMLRHRGAERPWLVCLHGFRMGSPRIDLSAFDPGLYHEKLGLNLMVPVLPLHGPRKAGWRSGDRFLDGDAVDTVHAEAQAIWDIRRLLSWIRSTGAGPIGVYGISLGGYNTALLASIESDLACAIAGVPLADMARIFWHHGPELHVRHAEHLGLGRSQLERVFRPIAPLSMEPRVPREHRAIFGGVCDRIVPVEMIRDLWRHWERPRIEWYQGGHLSFNSDPRIAVLIRETLRDSGLSGA